MQIQDIQNYFFYAGIVLAVIISAFVLLQIFRMDELANKFGIVGAMAAFLFGITGLVMKKRVDRQRSIGWKKT